MNKAVLFLNLFLCFSHLYGQKTPSYLSRVSVEVQTSIEMMCVIHYLAGYLDLPETSYADSVKKHFLPHKNHEAILRLRKLIATRSQEDAGSLLHFGRYFEQGKYQNKLHPIDSLLIESYYNKKEWIRFTQALASFYIDSNFELFFQKQKPYYQSAIQSITALLIADRYTIPEAEAFFQDNTQTKWQFYICPLLTLTQGQTLLPLTKETKQPFQILLGYVHLDTINISKKNRLANFQHILLHESGHVYLSATIFNNFRIEILGLRGAKAKKYSDFQWWNKVDESIVHGFSIFVEYSYLQNQLNWERDVLLCEKAGFLYTQKCIELTRYYDANRNQFSSYLDFLPYLFKNL